MQILTVVIGLIFVLLLLSLLATTIMELLSSLFSLRGRNLIKALRNMLSSSDSTETVLADFRSNSLYRHLTQRYARPNNNFDAPSYMSAETFQSILFDVILKGRNLEELPQQIEALPDEDLRNVLNQLLRESGGQLDLFRLEVQNWYNNVMDRAAGWYKRYTQKILLFLGLGIAVIFNADTVDLYEKLSNDPETLAQLVLAAEQYVDAQERASNLPGGTANDAPRPLPPATTAPAGEATTGPDPGFGTGYVPRNPLDTAAAGTAARSNTAPASPPPAGAPTAYRPNPTPTQRVFQYADTPEEADFQTSLSELKVLLNNEIADIRRPLGLGWEGVDIRAMEAYELISKLLGFILTALAISLGAPFWFDLLKKLVNIRSSGGRPYEN